MSFGFERGDEFGKQLREGMEDEFDGLQPIDCKSGHVKLEVRIFGQEIEVDNVGVIVLDGEEATRKRGGNLVRS
jgi:hypothetical protein